MNKPIIIFTTVIILIFCLFFYPESNAFSSSHSQSDYIHTLLVKLKPDLTDEEVKDIAQEYGCKIGHIYRFSYDKPHITVKFFVQDKDKTSLDILFDMEDDDRIISVTLDMPGQPQSAYAEEVRQDILTANTPMLEAIGWFKADKYYNQKLGQSDEVNTIIVQIGNGVDYKNYPWLKDYLYKLRGKIIGWDVVEEDAIPLDNDPEAEFRDKHETIGAQMMSTLSPHSKILPIRTYKSSRNDASFINMQIGLEQAIESIEFNEMVDQKDYNVVVNIPLAYWLNSPGTRMKLRRFWRHNNEELLPRFQEQYEEELKKAGYTPNNISYEDIKQKDKLEDMAFRWLFDAIMEGTLSPKLNPPEGEGIWSSLSTMKEKGWIIVAGGGNYNVSKAYPAVKEEVEGVDQISIEEYSTYCPLSHDWVDLVAPNEFYVYQPPDYFHNFGGSSTSAFITTALYAQIWDIAPNLDHRELNKIIKNTATSVETLVAGPEGVEVKNKKLIHPYRAIRVANVYGQIKEFLDQEVKAQVEQIMSQQIEDQLGVNVGKKLELDDEKLVKILQDVKQDKNFLKLKVDIKNDIIQQFDNIDNVDIPDYSDPETLENLLHSVSQHILDELIQHSTEIIPDIGTQELNSVDNPDEVEYKSASDSSSDSSGKTQLKERFSPIMNNNSNFSGNSPIPFSPTTSW